MADDRPPRARALRPKATSSIAVTPIVVSDLSCHAVVGIEARHFRALVSTLGIPHVRAGHRLLVRADDLLEALERLRGDGGDEPVEAEADDAEQRGPLTPNQILDFVERSRAARRAG